MKSKSHILIPFVCLTALSALHAQDSEILATGIYDTGRLRTNAAIDFHAFNQWNGESDNPGNVGWNPNGIWWSFARFGGGASQHTNPELFNKLDASGQILLNLGVLWNEVDGALVGVVPPGVTVGAYLVPGLDIPEGSLPTWVNAWPFSYPEQIKLFEIDPATVPTTNPNWNDFQLNPPTEEQRLDNLQPYDITAGIKSAIEQGLLTSSTPWGIVFMPEEALPELTPNNPDWADRRGTVLDNRYMQLEVVTGGNPTWADYPVDGNGWVDTGTFMGWLNVTFGDIVWSTSLDGYIYLPESSVGDAGAWTYVFK
jgi:hypothetical protein